MPLVVFAAAEPCVRGSECILVPSNRQFLVFPNIHPNHALYTAPYQALETIYLPN
jgi:hypothetical protein